VRSDSESLEDLEDESEDEEEDAREEGRGQGGEAEENVAEIVENDGGSVREAAGEAGAKGDLDLTDLMKEEEGEFIERRDGEGDRDGAGPEGWRGLLVAVNTGAADGIPASIVVEEEEEEGEDTQGSDGTVCSDSKDPTNENLAVMPPPPAPQPPLTFPNPHLASDPPSFLPPLLSPPPGREHM
jgi:hypothetical protein